MEMALSLNGSVHERSLVVTVDRVGEWRVVVRGGEGYWEMWR